MSATKPPGRWKPGESGNPAGRTPGSGEIAHLRASIAKHVPDIITWLVEAAKAGDAGAARLLLERVIPPIKATEQAVQVDMPDASLTGQGRAVLFAAGAGNLSPGQAAHWLSGLGALAKLVESDELAARVAALETTHGIKS